MGQVRVKLPCLEVELQDIRAKPVPEHHKSFRLFDAHHWFETIEKYSEADGTTLIQSIVETTMPILF